MQTTDFTLPLSDDEVDDLIDSVEYRIDNMDSVIAAAEDAEAMHALSESRDRLRVVLMRLELLRR